MKPLSIKGILEEQFLEASAPCRIDAGGTWDIKSLALPLEGEGPVTVNMALGLRTRVSLRPFQEGWVRIASKGFSRVETAPFEKLPFHSPFGIFFAAVSHFGFHGLDVRIEAAVPVKSALGGSSTALVALLKALDKASVRFEGKKARAPREILHLGYQLEDAVSPGKSGLQDQAAAVYGGVHCWRWRYGDPARPLWRESLLDRKGLVSLSRRILVAYSGKGHVSSRINKGWIHDFFTGATREGWIRANRIVTGFASALKREDWEEAEHLLREEMAVRRKITPGALIPLTEELITSAERAGCGARFAGAGGGGSVWALGDPDRIEEVRKIWGRLLESVQGALILPSRLDPVGVR
ncbi:MAG: hypothetical protein JRH13_08735 [Deltaproteobacteria bacterium]|nr:hypothetical protein [Deltaproteobacteria bacterium]